MHIERIQIEEGFLDGLDVHLVPGLNVIIGARGTGKTSLIELIRFCLDIPSFTPDAAKKSRDHALSVLGSGQVTVTLSDGERRTTVSRTGNDAAGRASGIYIKPIVFSQTEIETIGLQSSGRLQLLDGFTGDQRQRAADETEAASLVRSLTSEVESSHREIEELERQIAGLSIVNEQLAQLAPQEEQLETLSSEANEKKAALDLIAAGITAKAVGSSASERLSQSISRWRTLLQSAVISQPPSEPWPDSAGADRLNTVRERVALARKLLDQALAELDLAQSEASEILETTGAEKVEVEEQARQLRRELETLQAGAGAVVRQGQQLREKKAQLESLVILLADRQRSSQAISKKRGEALDRLDKIRQQRFEERTKAAARLNKVLGPRIRIGVTRSGQYEAFAAAISDALRGSGIRYNELAPVLAQAISPRELLEAADASDYDFITEATGISKDRSARLISQLREVDLGALATVVVEDYVEFQLLDGTDYKDIAELSTGQRCTVVLPLVLQHTERLLIVDQPEDHIDNAFIADTLIKSLLARDANGQIIFSTHNANIPVLGDANRVTQMGSDGKRGFALASSSLIDPTVVAAISTVMEGGAAAFEKRATFYSEHGRR
ncbi:hypothetical protein GCM10007919_15320 [Rhizobium indigoferae]|nr:AAA family ATPase [Rhizobium indigoferae]GLR56808.1 hypothetical protein GCM10007919_15320 [Rhizobium indigoferae]